MAGKSQLKNLKDEDLRETLRKIVKILVELDTTREKEIRQGI